MRAADSGTTRWTVDLAATGATEPVLAGDVVIAAPGGAGATAYDLADGRERWHLPDAELPAAVVGKLVVFDLGGQLEARDAGTGTVLWQRPAPGGQLVQSRESAGVLLLTDLERAAHPLCNAPDAPCAAPLPPASGAAGLSSQVSLLDPTTGTPLWQVVVPGRADGLSSSLSSSQALVGLSATGPGTGGGQAGVQALSLRDGSAVWSFTADYIERTTAAGDVPAVTSGLDRSRAQTLNPTDGAVLWETAGVDALVPNSPFLDADHGQGFRRDPRTGTPQPGRVPFTYGLSASHDLLVGAGARTLTAVRDHQQAWAVPLPDGPGPITYLDVDTTAVASITSVGQPEERD